MASTFEWTAKMTSPHYNAPNQVLSLACCPSKDCVCNKQSP